MLGEEIRVVPIDRRFDTWWRRRGRKAVAAFGADGHEPDNRILLARGALRA